MSIYLLDLSEALQRIYNFSDGSIAGSFSGLSSTISGTANGIAGVGCAYALIRLYLTFMSTHEWPIENTIKLCMMVALYGNCVGIARIVDSGFKGPATGIEAQLAVETQDGQQIFDEYKTKYYAALDAKAARDRGYGIQFAKNAGVAIEKAFDKLMFNIWLLVVQLILGIMELVLFFFKIAGSLGSNLLLVFVPLSFGLMFIPGFEGSGVGILKFIMVFRLWGAVAAAIKYAAYKIGFFSIYTSLKVMAEAQNIDPVGPDWSVILVMLCFIGMMFLTPMFADSLISGSQAGGILSAATGMAMAKIVSPAMRSAGGAASGAASSAGRQLKTAVVASNEKFLANEMKQSTSGGGNATSNKTNISS